MKRKTLGIAVAVAVGVVSTSAFASLFGSNSHKGSLLIFPRIEVTRDGGVIKDTLITIVNDSSNAVRLKCFYASSDPLTTPYTSTAAGARQFKHFFDFTIDMTHNQAFTWEASSGEVEGASSRTPSNVGGQFGVWPDGKTSTAGELKCWAMDNDGTGTAISYNHLFGNATILEDRTQQAYEYTAWAFQSQVPVGTRTTTPGELHLDGVAYDWCPNMLLGSFFPSGAPTESGEASNDPNTRVTLASCNQDLRQAYTPTITKLTWTFWNQDEQARTGTHFCADSWYETSFPAASWPLAQFASLATETAYFRIDTTADKQVCGIDATTSAYVGIKSETFGAGFTRGTNLTGRGQAAGTIKYDIGPPDGQILPTYND